MAKTITLRLSDGDYEDLKACAESDNRPISNLIETAALRYIREEAFMDPAEEREITADRRLMRRISAGHRDAAKRRGRFAA